MSVTITRLYDDDTTARRAVRALKAAGSASHRPIAEKPEAVTWTAADIIAAIVGIALIPVGIVLLFIPGLGALVFGAIGGWLIHRAMESGVDVKAESVQRGAVLVTARVPDGDRARVEALLDRSTAANSDQPAYRKAG
jgi:hypothetical protein